MAGELSMTAGRRTESGKIRVIEAGPKSNGCGQPLFQRSVQGGAECMVLDPVCGRAFTVTRRGIYYIDGPSRAGMITVRLFDPAIGVSRA
jgi:hypothetical protein